MPRSFPSLIALVCLSTACSPDPYAGTWEGECILDDVEEPLLVDLILAESTGRSGTSARTYTGSAQLVLGDMANEHAVAGSLSRNTMELQAGPARFVVNATEEGGLTGTCETGESMGMIGGLIAIAGAYACYASNSCTLEDFADLGDFLESDYRSGTASFIHIAEE
ncbi:MAG: hypothetical protein KC912_12115 [Proteobacteria bacterium]|nr:hypothetical protein [Pseudomonadota bacterium]